MALNTAIQASLRDSSTSYGFWQTLPSAALTRTVLRSSAASPGGGFSWVVIDAEHGLITDKDYYDVLIPDLTQSRAILGTSLSSDLTTAVASAGASPIIRVPWGEEWLIKRALDAGAHGIVVPMCHDEAAATRIAQYCKYPPTGTRGYGPMFSLHAFSDAQPDCDYVVQSDKELLVIVQIESRTGLQQVEQIAAVDGIDAVLIGPFDLAMQTGMKRGSEEHESAMKRILSAAHSAGTDGNDAKARVKQGFDMVSVNTDVGVLGSTMTHELATAQGIVRGEDKNGKGY